MSVTRIASRYAKSLLDLAVEQNKLDTVVKDIESFKRMLENRDLFLMIKSPIINTTKKLSIFKELFEGKCDELTYSFYKIILNKGRDAFLPEIADEFIEQYRASQSISTVKLTTATELSEEALNKIKAKLVASSITKKDVEILTAVDPALIGGYVVEIGDKLYDASVAHKLNKLKKEFS